MITMSLDDSITNYDGFVNLIEECKANDDFPIYLEIELSDNATVRDVFHMCVAIAQNLGMEVRLESRYCFDCAEMHTEMIIDYPEVEDTGYPVQ